MAIRRKVRIRGKEPVTRINPLQTEKVQRNMERLNQIVHATSARVAEAAPPSVPAVAPAPAYAPKPVPANTPAPDPIANAVPDPIYVPDPEKIMSQADEDLRASMQQAQEAIKYAEALLLQNEEATEDRVVEAQRIAERAVAEAISQTDALLKPSIQAPAPQTAPQTPYDPAANSEVQ